MSNTKDCGRTCLDLALQGECYCKMGDCQKGVEYFEMALQVGTDDLLLLSAIYSQLGNACFYIQEYENALRFHKYDLAINSVLEYKTGMAKAYGNLGNTLKIIGRFDEAVTCGKRHLSISKEMKDRIGEARALYNLGNTYLSEAQKVGHQNRGDPGRYPVFAEMTLNQAVDYYRANLAILMELGDRAAVGRTCGNLGNAYYLLGDFENATRYHQQRLEIAREFDDKAAERRACNNLGNACVFRNEYEMAAEYYRTAFDLARQLGDRATEGQVCYSLGNLYTLLKDYAKAVEYHLLHLQITKELNDAVGLGRAYWSLGNVYTATGNTRKAFSYIKLHLDLSTKMGDASSQQITQQKLKDLKTELGLQESDSVFIGGSSADEDELPNASNEDAVDVGITRRYRSQKRDKQPSSVVKSTIQPSFDASLLAEEDDEKFFEMLNHFQGKRLNDQRCSYRILENSIAKQRSFSTTTPCLVQNESSSTSDSNAGSQISSARHVSLSVFGVTDGSFGGGSSLQGLTGINGSHSSSNLDKSAALDRSVPDDEFINLLVRTQSLRYDDQRSSIPAAPVMDDFAEEDFFNLIQRLQSNRLDDQRSSIPRSSSVTLPTYTPSASVSVQSSGTKKKLSKKQK